jgi:hypothetical protein
MSKRDPVKGNMSVKDIVMLMGEGNPGALSVMSALCAHKGTDFIWDVLELDDMNIRGGQIWVAYKDHCKMDIDAFIESISIRDPFMINTVNRECEQAGHVAVHSKRFSV